MVRFQEIAGIALTLVGFIIVVSIGADVVDGIQDTQTSGTAAFNVSEDGLEGLTTFGSYSPTLATVFIAGIILTVIGGIFFMGRRGEY